MMQMQLGEVSIREVTMMKKLESDYRTWIYDFWWEYIQVQIYGTKRQGQAMGNGQHTLSQPDIAPRPNSS